MSNAGDWKTFRNILCVRPDNLGDVLMTTPAIRALRECCPGRRITLLTSRAGAAIARHVPEVDEIVPFDPPWYRHAAAADATTMQHIVSTLASRRFEGAVLFNVFSQNPLPNAMLCHMAGIPRVAGYCRENPYALISDWLPDPEPLYGARHEVQRQLELVTLLGAAPRVSNLSLRVPDGHDETVRGVLKDAGIDPRAPWVLLHPGASETRRCFPPVRLATAARMLHHEFGLQVAVTGSKAEAALAESIALEAGEGVASLAGRLELDAFIALVAIAPLLISNNTGPVHIAAAVQTPVVVLYAETNPQHTPWQVAHRVLPFAVPHAERSRNVILRFAAERFYPSPAPLPMAQDIVTAVGELLQVRASAATMPVPPAREAQGAAAGIAKP